MNRKKLNKLMLKKIFKGIVDTMIPASNDKVMPKATNAINPVSYTHLTLPTILLV